MENCRRVLRWGGKLPCLVLSLATFFAGSSAWLRADSLIWDATGANPNNPMDGSGAWDTKATNKVWSNVLTAPGGFATDSAWSNAAANAAVFGNNVGGIVTIDSGNITVGGLTFNNTSGNINAGYSIVDGGIPTNTLTLSGSNPIITANANAEMAAQLLGTGGFLKNGSGTLTLLPGQSGSGTNTYTGAVAVTAGGLVLQGSTGSTIITGDLSVGSAAVFSTYGTNLIAATSHLTVNGTFNLGQTQMTTQSLAGLSGNGGINLGEGSTLTLNLTQSGMFNGLIAGQGNVTLSATPNTTVETWTTSQNYFQGSVTINGGVLSVGALAALGENPNLTLNGGIFRYTGAGDGSGFPIQLGLNGGTLDASGTGAVNFAGQITGQSGSPALTLTGSSSAGNVITGPLSGPTSLTKSGTGFWIIGGGGTPYSPTSTQITSGTLEIENGGNTGGSSFTLGGEGILEVSQQSASLAVASGKVFSASGGSIILNNIPSVAVGTLTRPTGGGLVIVPTSSTALSNTERMGVLAGVPTVNGIVDASLVAQNSVADTTGDFLSYNNSAGFLRATYATVASITNGSGGTSATSVFHATTATSNTVTAASRIYALKVDSGAAVNGTTLTLGDGTHTAGLIINSNSVSTPTQISAPIAFGSSEGAVYVGGNVVGAPSGPYALIASQVTGTAGLTKNGSGVLELPTAFYTGTTTINQGTLQFDNTGPAGIGSTSVINLAGTVLYKSVPSVGATFNLLSDAATIGPGPNSAVSIQGTINGNGHALNVGGPNFGSILLGGTESNVLQYNVLSSTLQIAGSLGGGSAPIAVAFAPPGAEATLEIKSGSTVANPIMLGNGLLLNDGTSTLTGVLTLASPNGTIDPASGTLTLAAPVEGTAPLTINGFGSVTLSGGTNTYTGLTQIAQGTLNVAGAIANTSQVIIGSNATLNLTSGSLNTTGTIGNYGTMVLGSGVTVSSSGTFTNYGTLDLRNDPTFTLPANFVNDGTVLYANGPATDIPAMPEWALIAMGGLLLVFAGLIPRKHLPG